MISSLPGVKGPRRVFFVLAAGRVGLFLLVPGRFLVAVSCVFVGVGFGASQLVVLVPVGCTETVMGMRLMLRLHSSL